MKKREKQLSHVDTVIGSGTTFEGNLNSKSSIRIDGQLNGAVNCEGDIVIGTDGKVEADVNGRNITLAGTIIGNVKASNTLKIESTGVLKGDASMSVFIIDEGGKFDGTSSMQSEKDSTDSKKNKEQNKNNKNKDKVS